MKYLLNLLFGIAFCFCFSFYSVGEVHKATTVVAGKNFEYEYVDNDPLKARIYTLQNGLKLYMTYYRDEPRVQTFIAVRAGSKHDPSDATGLAHYLEHMLFKGTDQFATKNWEMEKPLLDRISDLYELHRSNDAMRKTARTMGYKFFPMIDDMGISKLPVTINESLNLSFIITDTISGIRIPQDVMKDLVMDSIIKPEDFMEGKPIKVKDGAKTITIKSHDFIIRDLKFGSLTFNGSPASVTAMNTPLLISSSFLSTLKNWKIDMDRDMLVYIDGTTYADINPSPNADTLETMKQYVYHLIDSISGEAAKYAIANEYDKMINGVGAKGTNAYTSEDRTVYVNEIPANELEKWMMVESNRFKKLVLRLFHTELEAVYEEFNRGQDNDYVKTFEAIAASLFRKHTYGTQTTIGKGEHLKNPSMVKINEYFNKYYVPNNIAICMSGDFGSEKDMEKTVFLLDKYFGDWQPKEVIPITFEKEDLISQPIVKEIYGRQEEFTTMAYRLGGANSRDAMMMKLVNKLLYNGRAGLMDLNLMQAQKILSVGGFTDILRDYSTHVFIANPREGQKLEEVKDLLLGQIEKLKKGEFDEWLIKAVVNQMKLEQMRDYEKNRKRAHDFVESFTEDVSWQDAVNEMSEMEKVTKQQVMDFVSRNYSNNYVVVYKRTGENKNTVKVTKPKITPVSVDRDAQSDFARKVKEIPSLRLSPKYLDFNFSPVSFRLINQIELLYIKNDENNLFTMYYILDMGMDNNKLIELAINYLPFLGTDKYTAAQLQQEFYKLGVSLEVSSSRDRVYITASGLDQNLSQSFQLFEHFLEHVKADPQAYKDMVNGILKQRTDAKLDKNVILRDAMLNYAMYGKTNPFTNILSETELKAVDPEFLVGMIQKLSMFKHRLFYFGPREPLETVKIINDFHRSSSKFLMIPPPLKFTELTQDRDMVYFVDYDMVQAEFMLTSKVKTFDKTLIPKIYVYNDYFGRGLSSIVFQEIREAKALAYSAYSDFTVPKYADRSHYMNSYVGTQVDKFKEASTSIREIMENMPVSEKPFNAAKDAVIKKFETERITKTEVFWEYENARKLGLVTDLRKEAYEAAKTMTLADLQKFQQENIKGKKYTYLVIGKKDKIDMNALNKIGEVKTLSLQEIFGY